MKNKNARIAIGGIALLCLAACIAGYFVWQKAMQNEENLMRISVYFLNPATYRLEAEEHSIPRGDNESMANATMALISKGPKSKHLAKTIPDTVKLQSGSIIDNDMVLEVDFSPEYADMSTAQELFFRSSVVYTMTELPFISQVRFYVAGEELLNHSQTTVGLMNRSNLVIAPVVSPDKVQRQLVKLYFSDEQALFLVPEERRIIVNPDQPIEKYVVEQLIAGPKETGHYPTVPTETAIREVRTADGICYVNLSAEFISKHSGGSASERMTIYSIVNSLTELSHVKKVQFLIDSEKVDVFKGSLSLLQPLERDEDILSKE